jgi:hypothetical protein
MAETFIQVPPNSTGAKLRHRDRLIGGETVLEQAVFSAAAPTYYALADNVAFANGKTHFSLYNAAGSGLVLAVRKIFAINLQTAAITGAALRMNVNRFTTAHTGGTPITPISMDTQNPALPAQITCLTNGTVTGPTLLYPFIITTEEEAATAALTKNMYQAMTNLQPEGQEIQELRLREGQGMSISQVTNATVGTYAWFIVFTALD